MSRTPIEVQGVRKSYPRLALDVSLEVRRGEVLGLIGPNGAGKSTLLRILTGLVRPDAGRVAILGREMPVDEAWIKARVGFVSEDMALYGAKTLGWHMGLVASLHEGWDATRAEELLTRLSLDPGQRAGGMSRGQQVKSLLLLALARRAEVLILDEPTAGLDPLARHELIRFLAETRDERQAMVFSSHHGQDVAALAGRVAFVHGGRIVTEGAVAGFLEDGGDLDAAFVRCASGRAA